MKIQAASDRPSVHIHPKEDHEFNSFLVQERTGSLSFHAHKKLEISKLQRDRGS